ncbi:DNA gyrase inhibitor YacG [Geobacter sp. OR-1]|uniref:DNA gyrase inhibitor YacG n=1 Tax=Geobacter sp. OR-1 TaxID=1266765 RepID=UPI0009DF076A|nr:DNA gyrase inhibitor YacG [Geobacter sp. OR-1]
MAPDVNCPICRRAVVWEGNPDRPFCSNRCRMVDLGAWAAGEYAVPCEQLPDDAYPETE